MVSESTLGWARREVSCGEEVSLPQPFLKAGGWAENLWRALWPGSPMSQQPSMTEWMVRARDAWPRHPAWLLPTLPTGVHDCANSHRKRGHAEPFLSHMEGRTWEDCGKGGCENFTQAGTHTEGSEGTGTGRK